MPDIFDPIAWTVARRLGGGNGSGGGVAIKNQDKTITENGTYKADSGYTGLGTVNVNVPAPSGTVSITENGSYDVTNFATALVEIAASGGGGLDLSGFQPAFTDAVCGSFVLDKETECSSYYIQISDEAIAVKRALAFVYSPDGSYSTAQVTLQAAFQYHADATQGTSRPTSGSGTQRIGVHIDSTTGGSYNVVGCGELVGSDGATLIKYGFNTQRLAINCNARRTVNNKSVSHISVSDISSDSHPWYCAGKEYRWLMLFNK